MSSRRSIEIPGLSHGDNPIPAGSRIGPLFMSGGIAGLEQHTGKLAADVEAQCAAMFTNVQRLIEAAGGTTGHIVKMTIWVKDRGVRTLINRHWLTMFPDPASRPVRHVLLYADLPGAMQMQCDVTAFIE